MTLKRTQEIHDQIHQIIKEERPEVSLLALKYSLAEVFVAVVDQNERPRALRLFDETLRETVRKLQEQLDKMAAEKETLQ